MFRVLLLITMIALFSCNPEKELPSIPLAYYSFAGSSSNEGIEKLKIFNSELSYAESLKDSCLDLSIDAKFRSPISIQSKSALSVQDHEEFSAIVWVKKSVMSKVEYGILGNKAINLASKKGWIIASTREDSWQLQISDGTEQKIFKGSADNQNINDNEWHQLAFTYSKSTKELKLYFDGNNTAVFNTNNISNIFAYENIIIGCDPGVENYSKHTFYGQIDELGIWSRCLSAEDIANAYLFINPKGRLKKKTEVDEELKILTWNIWNGGTEFGKEAGIDKIAQIIKQSDADIICLQEHFNSGSLIANKLSYYYYEASNNICIISKFPIAQSHPVFKSKHIGLTKIQINEEQSVLIGSFELSKQANFKKFLTDTKYDIDSILKVENEVRAKEMKFILNEIRNLNKENLPLILTGNLNSGSHLDWTERNKRIAIPFPSSLLLKKMNYTDAFRELYPNEINNPGITSAPLFKETNKERLDYIYYKSNVLRSVSSKIIDHSDSFYPSNHSALLITFSIE